MTDETAGQQTDTTLPTPAATGSEHRAVLQTVHDWTRMAERLVAKGLQTPKAVKSDCGRV